MIKPNVYYQYDFKCKLCPLNSTKHLIRTFDLLLAKAETSEPLKRCESKSHWIFIQKWFGTWRNLKIKTFTERKHTLHVLARLLHIVECSYNVHVLSTLILNTDELWLTTGDIFSWLCVYMWNSVIFIRQIYHDSFKKV